MLRRPERLAEALREEISEVVGYELNDPRLSSVTVTYVRVSDDLRDAKVFVLVEGDERETSSALRALQGAASFVRRQVAMNMSLRHVPMLHFALDKVEERASRIENLLDLIGNEKEKEL
ncbi:MAG TPA: 30S ribosome-binding factor RbfA [Pyrinomonadaceae bacterium]|jgi:ribosome-binding factor A|nr:30S ribosome-binding factor RbfA [Pyrinomonadaceae bacterium]